jgi:hypothetical protein
MILGTCLLALALAASTTTALAAPSISVQVPATAKANTDVNVTYAGLADAGDAGPTGAMMFHAFYEQNAKDCAPTVAQQRGRSNAKFDGNQYVGAPTPTPFSVISTVAFPVEGTYRFCVFLSNYPVDENAPPAMIAQATIQVGAGSTPCIVPNVIGQTLKSATNRLKIAGCTLGRVFKPRKVPKKRTLIVKSQSVKKDVMVAAGSKVNLTLKLKKKR